MTDIRTHPHARATRMLAYALAAESAWTWHAAASVWASRLTVAERGALAFAALRSLDPDDREMAFEAAHWNEIGPTAGVPLHPLGRAMDEAANWVTHASRRELEAYLAAAFDALPADRKREFLGHVDRRAVA